MWLIYLEFDFKVEIDMNPTEIAQAYDQITHLWQRDDFDMSNGISQHKRAMHFVKNKGKALDIGCGCTGRIIQLMLDSGLEPQGLDLSTQMLQQAKQIHPNINFIHADICQYPLSAEYDFISAWDSLWHIPLNQQKQVLSNIINGLKSGGVFITSFGGLPEANEHTNAAMGPAMYYATLGVNDLLSLFIESGCIVRHLEYEQYSDLHAFVIVEKR